MYPKPCPCGNKHVNICAKHYIDHSEWWVECRMCGFHTGKFSDLDPVIVWNQMVKQETYNAIIRFIREN